MIELKMVTKVIKKNTVLDDISFCFEDGKVYGLWGENGSGKTMLLRTIAGLILPTEGEIFCNGKKLHEEISFPENTGIVIEHMELLPRFTARENLKLLARIRKTASEEDIEEALKAVGLQQYADQKVKKFSLGMKQRLNIAQAIFEKQKLILLDEPTNALDGQGVEQIYRLIKEQKERGATVIIATHHRQDLQELCDVVIELSKGKLIGNQ